MWVPLYSSTYYKKERTCRHNDEDSMQNVDAQVCMIETFWTPFPALEHIKTL